MKDFRYLSGYDRALRLIEEEGLPTREAILARLREYRTLLVEASEREDVETSGFSSK